MFTVSGFGQAVVCLPCRWSLCPVLCEGVPRGEGPHHGGDTRGIRKRGEVCHTEAGLRQLPISTKVPR